MTGLGRWGKSDREAENSSDMSQYHKIDAHEKIFVDAFLRLSQVFFTLVRLPIYELPTIQKFRKTESSLGKYQLEMAVPAIQFVAVHVYKKTLGVALEQCSWIMQHPATA